METAHSLVEDRRQSNDDCQEGTCMYVVGGHGYVGSRVVDFAAVNGTDTVVVSRNAEQRRGVPSIAWTEFLASQARTDEPSSIVWLLDGIKHAEAEHLDELLQVVSVSTHIALVSSCTVYGDRNGEVCDEDTPVHVVTANAEVKASSEAALHASPASWSALRFGALYGPDDRGVRKDRVEKWVTQAAHEGIVTTPAPSHWRGWLHRDQAARALYRAADRRLRGVFNVASSNYRFGEAASFAAALFNASLVDDGKPDPLNYRVDADRARGLVILDELPGEDIASTVTAFARQQR